MFPTLVWELFQELAIHVVVIDRYNIWPHGGHVKVATTIQILPFPDFYFCFFSIYCAKYIFNTILGQNLLEMFGWKK